ncbi:MAG: ABC transporter substrate-binding protein [Anaerolineales bacterium]|nr:MAG: ABC transporter substrate-binding protein [Anaerolineales bacterium]
MYPAIFVRRKLISLVLVALSITVMTVVLSSCATAAAPTETIEPPSASEPAPTATDSPPPTVETSLALVDGLGRTVDFEVPPQRIVSIAPSNTEILFAVGAAAQIVGRDELSDFPAEALEVTSIGSTYGAINAEAIVALEPDLILVADITPIEQINALTDLGLKVFQISNPMSFDDLFANLAIVGKITGNEQQASTLVDALKARVEAVEEAVADAGSVRVFYEVDGTDPTAPWTTGTGTFQQVLIEMVKGENVAEGLVGWGAMNLEQIVERDPEVIIFGSGPWVPTTTDSLAERSGWAGISAVLNGRIFGVDTNWIDRPGPRLVDALERFAQVVQPTLFE